MKLSGSSILIECLKEQGVDTVFGFPGGTVLNIYDELYKHKNEIKHILTSHEQGAAHAADGYARATGKVGVCITTSGPGATNLVTGIATAYMDSVPMVAITGNVPLNLLGKDSFQEVDIAGITMPVTKHSFIVKDINKLAETIRRAFAIASSGRPGPVLVDIVKDVTDPNNKIEYTYVPTDKQTYKILSGVCLEGKSLNKAAKIIRNAKKPVIFIGGGAVISHANDEIRELAYKIDAPVCDTLMGKGAFDAKDDIYLGMLGMHGTKTSNYAVSECDLLIAIGVRFSDRIMGNSKKYASNAKIIHIDIDPAEINKNIRVDADIVGDAKIVLDVINKMVERSDNSEWLKHILDIKKKNPLEYNKDRLSGPGIIEKIYDITNGDVIISTDVGQHQMWAAQFFKYSKPRTFLTSGGLGTMGYGLGAAIGAKIGCPDKTVINIAGDGCFRMNMNELATAARYKIGLIEIILNNHALGMVRQWQELFYGKRYSETIFNDNIDIVKISEGLGVKAFQVNTKEEFEETFKEALALNEPIVIECIIDTSDNVWPMVAPGDPISKTFTAKDIY